MTLQEVLARLEALGCRPRRVGRGWQARCPAHDDRNPSLSIGLGDGDRVLLHCHAGCEFASVADAIGWERGRRYHLDRSVWREGAADRWTAGIDGDLLAAGARRWGELGREGFVADAGLAARLVRDWTRAVPFEGSPGAHDYLTGRGLSWRDLEVAGWPAWRWLALDPIEAVILGPFVGPAAEGAPPVPEGVPGEPGETFRGLHVTYVRRDGRGRWTKRKRRFFGVGSGSLRGARVALWPLPEGTMAVAEGIEDAFAVAIAEGVPCQAAGSTSQLEHLAVGPGRRVRVYADADEVGRKAAAGLRRRLGPDRVQVLLPTVGKDPCEAVAGRPDDVGADRRTR
ncbi:MAG: toprim domain-containing protein [Armatimonadota bacterium]|nr:toprim domain-containing protein [Armatimonadota bacterium]